MALHNHAGVPVGWARPRNHRLSLNLDTHEDLLSLLQSNVSRRRPFHFCRTIELSIAVTVPIFAGCPDLQSTSDRFWSTRYERANLVRNGNDTIAIALTTTLTPLATLLLDESRLRSAPFLWSSSRLEQSVKMQSPRDSSSQN